MEYVTQASYDDAGRVQQLVYPRNAATIAYSYDTAGHLSQVKKLVWHRHTGNLLYPPRF